MPSKISGQSTVASTAEMIAFGVCRFLRLGQVPTAGTSGEIRNVDNRSMVWVASLLLFVAVGGGVIGVVVVRNRLRDDGADVRELPADVLIALARSREAELASRKTENQARPESAQEGPPFRDA